jgi:uncharacterized phage-associated protein
MPRQTLQAADVTRYFRGTFDQDAGDNISNLKLQKLLDYAQGFHLAMHGGNPLFPEPVIAWDHGPVVETSYHQNKRYGWQEIDRPQGFDINDYRPDVREHLDTVYRMYGQFSAKGLEEMTHKEPPWNRTARSAVISLESLREYFSKLVEAGKTDQSVFGEPVWPMNSFRYHRRRDISERMAPHRDRLGAIARRSSLGADPWAEDDN